MSFEMGRFQRADRLLHTRDFRAALKSGKRRTSSSFVVVVTPRTELAAGGPDATRTRLGITVSKRVGGAVVRNHLKRRIREWFRHAREGLPSQSDIVVIARRAARDLSSHEVEAALDRITHGARAR